MPKKIYISLLFTMVVATIALFAATPAAAAPCDFVYPCPGGAEPPVFEDFLQNACGESDYFFPTGAPVEPEFEDYCQPISSFNFEGTWEITPIAHRAGNNLTVTSGTPAAIMFDSENCSNWGIFQTIDFVDNLTFTDETHGSFSHVLDPYATYGEDFKVCLLKEDSNLLDYLENPVSLSAGDYIIGWNNSGEDEDFLDIVIAARPVEVEVCDADGSARTRDGCASLMEIEAGTVYMSYQRIGICDVDEEGIRFYLNSPLCNSDVDCPDEPAPGFSCQYMEGEIPDCEDEEASECGGEEGPPCPSFCIAPADVQEVLCIEPDSPCPECMDVDSGSPTCVNYKTPSGTRIKSCFTPSGTTCPWKKCCKLGEVSARCGF